jgi:hypothetical protein
MAAPRAFWKGYLKLSLVRLRPCGIIGPRPRGSFRRAPSGAIRRGSWRFGIGWVARRAQTRGLDVFRHGPQPRPDGRPMSDAKSGLTASLVGRHRSPSPGKFDECVALSWSRGTNGEGITKSRKLLAFFIRHDALLQLQGGNITLLERACGAHAARRIQSGNLRDTEARRSPAYGTTLRGASQVMERVPSLTTKHGKNSTPTRRAHQILPT